MLRGSLILLLFSAQALAGPFLNLREERSFYIGDSEMDRVQELYERQGVVTVHSTFQEILKGREGICGEEIIANLNEKYPSEEVKDLLLAMRNSDQIDDMAYMILEKTTELDFKKPIPVSKSTAEKLNEKDKIIEAYKSYLKRDEHKECGVDNYSQLVGNIRKYADKFNKRFLKKANYLALHNKIITDDQFEALEKYRQGKVYEWPLTLKSYAEKVRGIRTQYPLETEERSNFITEKVKKTKLSRRQQLFEKYSYYQIILMGDVIKKMRKRLDSTKIEIVIYDENGDRMEVIELSPMERFRFILKLLRKEMDILTHNTFFNGLKPTYIEIITAAFELGMIPAEELTETAKLEEIWNPTKSRWEKIVFWLKTFGSVSAVLIPPPWGFVSVLALMGLEATTNRDDDGPQEDINLF